jgi:hypothetical protein
MYAGKLAGNIEMSKLSACGHSFGAATCITACMADSRFKACVCHDVWLFPLSEVLIETAISCVAMLLSTKLPYHLLNLHVMRHLEGHTTCCGDYILASRLFEQSRCALLFEAPACSSPLSMLVAPIHFTRVCQECCDDQR